MLSDIDYMSLPSELAAGLSSRSGVHVTREEVLGRFYFYVFPVQENEDRVNGFVMAIDANHPKGEKWLRVDNGRWVPSERIKF